MMTAILAARRPLKLVSASPAELSLLQARCDGALAGAAAALLHGEIGHVVYTARCIEALQVCTAGILAARR